MDKVYKNVWNLVKAGKHNDAIGLLINCSDEDFKPNITFWNFIYSLCNCNHVNEIVISEHTTNGDKSVSMYFEENRILEKLKARVNRVGMVQSTRMLDFFMGSSLFDEKYLAMQFNVNGLNRYCASIVYFSLNELRYKPNPLFDPRYYISYNNIRECADPLFDYCQSENNHALNTSRMFDANYYLTQDLGAIQCANLLERYWNHGYRCGIYPVPPEQIEKKSNCCDLFFGKNVDQFDAVLYRAYNNDLIDLDDELQYNHFLEFGRMEPRVATKRNYSTRLNVAFRYVPIDFSAEKYEELYLDLAGMFHNTYDALEHYLLFGIGEGRSYSIDDLFGIKIKNSEVDHCNTALEVKTCILLHLYRTEMWEELLPYIKNASGDVDLFVNMVDSAYDEDVLLKIKSDFPYARIYISQNQGRDIGGFIRLLDAINIEDYFAFTFLHTKKSPHVSKAYVERWKSNLLDAILGNESVYKSNITEMIRNDVGIVGSLNHRMTDVSDNQDQYIRLLDMLNIEDCYRDCEYVSGTMMTVRSEIVRHIYNALSGMEFEDCDNTTLDFHIDGQLAHAVERVFGCVMKQHGLKFLWK